MNQHQADVVSKDGKDKAPEAEESKPFETGDVDEATQKERRVLNLQELDWATKIDTDDKNSSPELNNLYQP